MCSYCRESFDIKMIQRLKELVNPSFESLRQKIQSIKYVKWSSVLVNSKATIYMYLYLTSPSEGIDIKHIS